MKNLKLKALAAAVTMAMAGQASAALSGDTQGNGTLFLTVWDVVTNESYVRDLGVSIDSFLPTSVTPSGALNSATGVTVTGPDFNFGSSTLFQSVFSSTGPSANSAANLRFTIVGVDNQEGTGNPARFVSTVNNAYAGSPALLNAQVRGVAINSANFQGELVANIEPGLGDGTVIEAASCLTGSNVTTGTCTAAEVGSTEGGGSGWGPSLGSGSTLNHAGVGYGTAQFWFASTPGSQEGNSATASATRFGNGANFATFALNSDGSVTYSLAEGVAAVPLPAAAWLMGAGLLGLGGAARRRKAAAKA